jgi:hypothetical protein
MANDAMHRLVAHLVMQLAAASNGTLTLDAIWEQLWEQTDCPTEQAEALTMQMAIITQWEQENPRGPEQAITNGMIYRFLLRRGATVEQLQGHIRYLHTEISHMRDHGPSSPEPGHALGLNLDDPRGVDPGAE